MKPEELRYNSLLGHLQPLLRKGRTESATFLDWFLENIYRLDSVAADDCICDSQGDKGVDGVYVDTNNEEIHFFQAKIRQKDNGTVGDTALKEFSASVKQFDTSEKVESLLSSDASEELKKLLIREDVKGLLDKGYRPVGVYLTNESIDEAASNYLDVDSTITVFHRESIAAHYMEADQDAGINGSFSFDISYVSPLQLTIGSGGKGRVLRRLSFLFMPLN